MKKLLVFTAMLCLLTAGLFAGGSRSTGSANEVTLSMITRLNVEVVVDNNPLLQYIREKYGYNIQMEAPPINSYNDRLQILMASGDLPDLVYIWSLNQNYIQWAEQGLLNPVDDLIKDYPNLMHNITPEQVYAASIPSDGKAYGVPKTNKENRWGYFANIRYLNKLGIEGPTTLEEFYEFGRLLRDNDPTGTGETVYLISPDGDIFAGGTTGSPVVTAFIPNEGAPDFTDGIYKIRERMSGYYPFLDYMRRLYEERILDPEYIVNRTYGGRTKVDAGRVAVVATHDSVLPQDSIANNNGALDFLEFFPALKGPDGIARNYLSPAVWGVWALPKSSRKTQDALRFLDWGNSPEGFEVLYNGIPGVTYTSYDLRARTVVQTEAQRRAWEITTSSNMTVAFAFEGIFPYCSNDPKLNDYYNKSLANYMSVVQDIVIPAVKNPDMDIFNAANPDLITRRSELENRYVVGTVSRTELQNFINNEWLPRIARAEASYQRIMAELNR